MTLCVVLLLTVCDPWLTSIDIFIVVKADSNSIIVTDCENHYYYCVLCGNIIDNVWQKESQCNDCVCVSIVVVAVRKATVAVLVIVCGIGLCGSVTCVVVTVLLLN